MPISVEMGMCYGEGVKTGVGMVLHVAVGFGTESEQYCVVTARSR